MNTICPQCGSVLPSGVHECSFCEFSEVLPLREDASEGASKLGESRAGREAWRGELNQRLQAYRAKRRKAFPNELQSALPFVEDESPRKRVVVEDPRERYAPQADDFAFTIAIGRMAPKEPHDDQVLIDVSTPLEGQERSTEEVPQNTLPVTNGMLPMAPLCERRNALLIDGACLAFAYGSFLALFGSLGGQFEFSKLSAAVCVFTFAFVYVQYFGLFTVFGGSTPGMMLTGLQVASMTGDVPTPRQYVLRAAGYVLSAGTCFLGFLWVLWDEDRLTWHDRISQTYLMNIDSLAEEDVSQVATVR